jgi:hypothetical protein
MSLACITADVTTFEVNFRQDGNTRSAVRLTNLPASLYTLRLMEPDSEREPSPADVRKALGHLLLKRTGKSLSKGEEEDKGLVQRIWRRINACQGEAY